MSTEENKRIEIAKPGDAQFVKYRPTYHFLSSYNWINDPCAPYYDPQTETYHLFYQYNPNATYWGDMTWGHAISKDQCVWKDEKSYALEYNQDIYDAKGCFSGSAVPCGISQLPTIFYTGITCLPIHHTLPYVHNPEHVCYATSKDHGKTWQKGKKPLILEPPPYNVIGWRDPHVFQSILLTQQHFPKDDPKEHCWMIVSGGIRDQGGRNFLYHSTKDYMSWKFHSIVFQADCKQTFDNKEERCGNFGYNFEMTNYFELQDKEGKYYGGLTLGTEGGRNGKKIDHYALWVLGEIKANGGLIPSCVGIGDAGGWYANSLFKDPISGKYVVYGWIYEENGFSGDVSNPNGWAGILALPREIELAEYSNVYDPENKLKGNWLCYNGEKIGEYQTKNVKTVGLKPISNFTSMRFLEGVYHEKSINVEKKHQLSTKSNSFELEFTVKEVPSNGIVGVYVRADATMNEYTKIYYDDKQSKIIVDRSKSCAETTPLNKPETSNDEAVFDLLHFVKDSTIVREPLHMRVFVDNSIIEVYANDRFALSARVYPHGDNSTSSCLFAECSSPVAYTDVNVYNITKKAWPERKY